MSKSQGSAAVAVDNRTKKCGHCKKKPAEADHPCPYARDIDGDESPCDCCDDCTADCAEQI